MTALEVLKKDGSISRYKETEVLLKDKNTSETDRLLILLERSSLFTHIIKTGLTNLLNNDCKN